MRRDEVSTRPTVPARFWDEYPDLVAGRDLLGGGTWLGITRMGRFAALTNVFDMRKRRLDRPTRGELTVDWLTGTESAKDYLAKTETEAARYDGFNLLFGTAYDLCRLSNSGGAGAAVLGPGLYGMSNGVPDEPASRFASGKTLLSAPTVDVDRLFDILEADTLGRVDAVRRMRSSTVILVSCDGTAWFEERTYGDRGSTFACTFDVLPFGDESRPV